MTVLYETSLLFVPPFCYFVLEADGAEQLPLLISRRLRCPHHGRLLDYASSMGLLEKCMFVLVYCLLLFIGDGSCVIRMVGHRYSVVHSAISTDYGGTPHFTAY